MKRAYAPARTGQVHLRLFESRQQFPQGQNAPQGPPPALVCLHPFPYSGAFFATLAPLLNGQRLVCAPDCPGYGGSDAPADMLSMTELAAAMHEALAAADLSAPFDVLGFHSGCLLAVEMARLEPGRVGRLALIDVPYFSPREQAGRYAKSTSAPGYTGDLDSLATVWEFAVARRLGGMPFGRAFGNFVELLRAGERANWGYHATLTYPCRPRFQAVEHETLVIATEYMLKEHTRKAAQDIPGARLVERRDVTRAVMEEGASAIAGEALAFLGPAGPRRSQASGAGSSRSSGER